MVELAPPAAEEAEGACAMNRLTRYARERPCHLTRQRPVRERVWLATLLAEVQLSVAQRQAWAQLSVVLDERQALRDLHQGHRAATAYPL